LDFLLAITVLGVALWQLVQHEDFENDVNYIVIPSYINSKTAQGWSFSEISNCDHGQVYPNKFIGGPCKLSNQQVLESFVFCLNFLDN